MIGNRLDVSFYKDRFDMISGIYPNKRLFSIVDIDPTIRFTGLADDTPISFIPMECIDETFERLRNSEKLRLQKLRDIQSSKRMICCGPRLHLVCRMGNRP